MPEDLPTPEKSIQEIEKEHSIMRKMGLPKQTGEYAVGTFTYTVKNDRKEIMRQGGMRSVAARVYYPVLRESVKRLTKAVALSDNMLKGIKDTFKVVPDFRKNPESNLTECYLNANRIPGKKFPLIMFNHAYNSYREGNSCLCTELASNGYVVISVDHSHEAVCSEFDDGTVLFFDKTIKKKMYKPMIGGIITMLKLVRLAIFESCSQMMVRSLAIQLFSGKRIED